MTSFTQWQRDPVTGQVLFDAAGNPLAVPNPDAPTYGRMQARIANEALGRATATDIRDAINDAISSFENSSFWFNDMRTFNEASGLTTQMGKEFYSGQDLPVLVNMPHIRNIMVLAFNNRYPLIARTQQWIDDVSVAQTWTGMPTDWCWVGGSIRIYPMPNAGYPLIITGTIRFTDLVNPDDTNPWVNEAEWLIRSEAKRLIFTNINRDELQAAKMEQEIYGNPQTGRQGALDQLQFETTRRSSSPGRIRASRGYF